MIEKVLWTIIWVALCAWFSMVFLGGIVAGIVAGVWRSFG